LQLSLPAKSIFKLRAIVGATNRSDFLYFFGAVRLSEPSVNKVMGNPARPDTTNASMNRDPSAINNCANSTAYRLTSQHDVINLENIPQPE
jgi:hypothetical protein